MAFSLNRAQIIGNLTRDPEVRQTPNGSSVASFGVATNFAWTDSSGQRQEKVEFHNIVAWRKLAEICQQYLKKGGKVYIEGRMQTRDWTGEDGVKRYRTEIVAENMIMLDRKGERTENFAGGRQDDMRNIPNEMNAPTKNSNIPYQPAKGGINNDGAAGNNKNEEEVAVDDLPF